MKIFAKLFQGRKFKGFALFLGLLSLSLMTPSFAAYYGYGHGRYQPNYHPAYYRSGYQVVAYYKPCTRVFIRCVPVYDAFGLPRQQCYRAYGYVNDWRCSCSAL